MSEVSREIIKLLETKDLACNEIFGILYSVQYSFIAAEIEAEIKERYGLMRVEK